MKRLTRLIYARWIVLAFSLSWNDPSLALSPHTDASPNLRHPTLSFTTSNRRAFCVANTLGLVVGTNVLIPPALAAIEDLTLPTVEEQKKTDEEAYQERLRRKVELQQQAKDPRSYREGLQAELVKQKQMSSKNQEERRRALCEELGRGC